MITLIASIVGAALLVSLGLWAFFEVRHRLRIAREEGREEIRADACNHLKRQADAKRLDGDKYTAAALESAALYILHDLFDETTEALRNQTRERELREKDLNHVN